MFLFLCSGMNQLLWYYADLELEKCEHLKFIRANESAMAEFNIFKYEREPEGCILWRRFSK